jgi:hypothetical protein
LDGSADLAHAVGALGENKLIAMQAAAEKLPSVYTCNFGAVEAGCEVSSANQKAVTCQVACKDLSGNADVVNARIGQGPSELEALAAANKALSAAFTCNFGSMKVTCQK